MTPSDQDPNVVAFDRGNGPEEPLPFRVELWDRTRGKPERVIGRAATIVLAQAIFAAAQTDFSGERIIVVRGSTILIDTQ